MVVQVDGNSGGFGVAFNDAAPFSSQLSLLYQLWNCDLRIFDAVRNTKERGNSI